MSYNLKRIFSFQNTSQTTISPTSSKATASTSSSSSSSLTAASPRRRTRPRRRRSGRSTWATLRFYRRRVCPRWRRSHAAVATPPRPQPAWSVSPTRPTTSTILTTSSGPGYRRASTSRPRTITPVRRRPTIISTTSLLPLSFSPPPKTFFFLFSVTLDGLFFKILYVSSSNIVLRAIHLVMRALQ